MNKIIAILVIVILLSFTEFIFYRSTQTVSQSTPAKNNVSAEIVEVSVAPVTDIQASFAIFTNGTFRTFTAAMYHTLSQDVYIEASNPNVIQVKKSGATWNDFSSTLPVTHTSQCITTGTRKLLCSGSKGTLQFFINGVQSSTELNQIMKDGDKLLITFGTQSEAKIKQQINKIP